MASSYSVIFNKMMKLSGRLLSVTETLNSFEEYLCREYYSGDQIKKNEIGQACSVYGREEMCVHTGFWWGALREKEILEDIGVDGSIILESVLKKCDGGMY
jgi:hypothetical protein